MADLDLPASPPNEDTSWLGLQHVESWEKQEALAATGVLPWGDSPSRDSEAHAEAHAAADAEAAPGKFPASSETAGPPAPGCSSPGTPESHQGERAAAVRATEIKPCGALMSQVLALANTRIKCCLLDRFPYLCRHTICK